jgi:small subunit ribosomal protein S2
MIVVDINYEDIAVAEGKRIGATVIGLVDTNSDPGLVTHPIPGNDDAVKSIRIVMDVLVEAIQAGLSQRDTRRISRGQQQIVAETRPVASTIQPIVRGPVAALIEEEDDSVVIRGVDDEPDAVVDDDGLTPKEAPKPADEDTPAETPGA